MSSILRKWGRLPFTKKLRSSSICKKIWGRLPFGIKLRSSSNYIKFQLTCPCIKLFWYFHWVAGWVGGWVAGSRVIIKLNSAQLELELGLSLAKINQQILYNADTLHLLQWSCRKSFNIHPLKLVFGEGRGQTIREIWYITFEVNKPFNFSWTCPNTIAFIIYACFDICLYFKPMHFCLWHHFIGSPWSIYIITVTNLRRSSLPTSRCVLGPYRQTGVCLCECRLFLRMILPHRPLLINYMKKGGLGL